MNYSIHETSAVDNNEKKQGAICAKESLHGR